MRFKDLKKDIEVLMSSTIEQMNDMRFEYQVNDKLDICVRIKPNKLKTDKKRKAHSEFHNE